MKLFHCAVVLWSAVAILCGSGSVRAQSPAPPSTVPPNPRAASPPADPFIRPQQNAPATPKPVAQPVEAATAPVNLLSVLETWTLDQTDFLALLDAGGDDAAKYGRLEGLAKAGKAKLSGLIAVTSKSGQRSVVESIDEVRYPVEFDPPAAAGEIAYPVSWQGRNAGDTMEIESVVGPDGATIDVNIVPQAVRLAGIDEWRAEAAAAPAVTLKFEAEKATTSLRVQTGRPGLLATATPAAARLDDHGQRPVRTQWLRVMVQKTPRPAAAQEGTSEVRIELLLYSLDRESARRILAGSADSAQSYATLRDLVQKGDAQLDVLSAVVARSGQRAVLEELSEVIFPGSTAGPSVDVRASSPAARRPASFTSFETRNTGVTMEIEPVVDAEGFFVDLNIVPQIVQRNGMLELGDVAAKYPLQPLFTTRKITTTATTGLGIPLLLGTMSQPRDNGVNGRKDDERTSLTYVRVTPLRP
jgi:hypothetical protein